MSDARYYQTFYGLYLKDWTETCCGVSTTGTTNYLLSKNYLQSGVSCASSTRWGSTPTIFLYPHNIKKDYVLEGTVEGQITFTSDPVGNTSYVSDYRITIVKISNCSVTELASTGIISPSVESRIIRFSSSATYHYGDYMTYPFWIEIYSNPKHIGENEKLGVKVEWDVSGHSSVTAALSHENDSEWEDFKITIPMLLG